MKKLAISVLCLSLSLPVFAEKQQEEETTPKLSKGAIIEEDLKIENKMNVYKIYGSLKDIDKNKSDKMRLQGKVYVSPCKDKNLKGYNIANIQWLGVQKIDSVDKVVGFKEPIVSSFMFKDGMDIKNIPLPTFGDEQDLVRAISDLEQDKIDLEDLKRKRKFKAVYGKPDDNKAWLVSNRRAKKVDIERNAKDATKIEPGLNSDMALDNSNKSKPDGRINSGDNQFHSSVGDNSNNLPGFQGADGSIRKPKDGERKTPESPNISVELTENGCNPEHDVLQERVIITARAKKIENGKVIDEGVCEKTLESYPVKRDYLCDECIDEVDRDKKKAYARYQEHWFDKDGERHNLAIKVDKSLPFEFSEDSRGCPFDTTSKPKFAIQMTKLGYLNKFRGYQQVEGCRATNTSIEYPITETTNGCDIEHDMDGKMSYKTSRLVFNKNGVEREARGCERVEPGFEHQFTTTGCKTFGVRLDGTNIPMFRRKINMDGQWKIITDECEPGEEHGLESTRDGCEGQFQHDFANGKSYLLKRYYFENNGRRYVSGCMKTLEFLEHQFEPNGVWEHDDKMLTSRPRLAIYVEEDGNKIIIDEAKARGDEQKKDYELLNTVEEKDGTFHYNYCFKIEPANKFNFFRRADSSEYKLLIGTGTPIQGKDNLCKQSFEDSPDGLRMRSKLVYPNGHIDYSPWQKK